MSGRLLNYVTELRMTDKFIIKMNTGHENMEVAVKHLHQIHCKIHICVTAGIRASLPSSSFKQWPLKIIKTSLFLTYFLCKYVNVICINVMWKCHDYLQCYTVKKWSLLPLTIIFLVPTYLSTLRYFLIFNALIITSHPAIYSLKKKSPIS